MAELFDDDEAEGESSPVLGRLTHADRLTRFGCGAILAGLVAFVMLLSGGLDLFGWPGAGVVGALLIGACGVLSAAYGDRFIRFLLKAAEWF